MRSMCSGFALIIVRLVSASGYRSWIASLIRFTYARYSGSRCTSLPSPHIRIAGWSPIASTFPVNFASRSSAFFV